MSFNFTEIKIKTFKLKISTKNFSHVAQVFLFLSCN